MSTSRFSLIAITCALACFSTAHARIGEMTEISPTIEKKQGPWFTGPLLTPSGHVVPLGYFNLEPYLFFTGISKSYDSEWHSHGVPTIFEIDPLLFTQIGLTKRLDFQITPGMYHARSQGRSTTQFDDLPLTFDYQLLNDTPGSWWPAIKLTASESFPTGKYQKLDPKKKGLDAAGSGSYTTSFGITVSRLFHVRNDHYLSSRLNFSYSIPSHVHVKGFNTYGGGFGTRGTVRPGNSFSVLLGMEYNLSLHWALALDIANAYSNKSTFSGKRGVTSAGAPAKVGGPSSNLVSLAPAIEYNFNQSVGLIAGVWFTVAGRNTSQFTSGVIALNWYGSFKREKIPAAAYSQGGKNE